MARYSEQRSDKGNSAAIREDYGCMDTLDEDEETIRGKLHELVTEHRDLDDAIAALSRDGVFNQLQLQRLKRKKLRLKDEVARLQSKLIPDIIA